MLNPERFTLKPEMAYPVTLRKPVFRNYDAPFVEFEIFCEEKGQLTKKRFKSNLSHFSGAARERRAREIINYIEQQLAAGLVHSTQCGTDLLASLSKMLEIRKAFIDNSDTRNTYDSQLQVFSQWCESRHPKIKIHEFSEAHAREFMVFLRDERQAHNMVEAGVSAKTRNTYRFFLSPLWDDLVSKGFTGINPWSKIPKLQESQPKRHQIFSDDECGQLKAAIADQDHQLWFAIQLLFYCFIRPKELIGLRVEDFDFMNQKIRVSSQIAKIHSTEYLSIPDVFFPDVIAYIHDSTPKNFLIFSKDRSPGRTPLNKKTLSRRFVTVRNNLQIASTKTFYAWKHTGNVRAVRAGVPIWSLSKQNRHTSIQTTEKYLRDLGLFVHDELRGSFPKL